MPSAEDAGAEITFAAVQPHSELGDIRKIEAAYFLVIVCEKCSRVGGGFTIAS